MKLWQEKNFNLDKKIELFTVGRDALLDQLLVKADVVASIAHAFMLNRINVLTSQEFRSLKKELCKIIQLDKKNKFRLALEDEDVHTKIENYLTKMLGKTGKKIHTGRSRNDQVLVDLRLYSKEKILAIEKQTLDLCLALAEFAQKNSEVPMPGYTHMRKAMLSSIGLWAGSFAESLLDDLVLLRTAYKINNQNPLGSAAGYGVPLSIDRQLTTRLLGFEKTQNNLLYVQNSRGKIELIILNALVQIMLDLNKFATDLLLFTMPEFGFFEIPGKFCTGSSIMPQKKNADVLELVRANYYVLAGYASQVNGIIGSLPSGYNRDFQLTKEPLINSLELANSTVSICIPIISKLKINRQKLDSACTSELFAADLIFGLTQEGIPFRDAYKKIKSMQSWSKLNAKKNIRQKKYLGATGNLGLKKLKKQIIKNKKIVLKEKNSFDAVINRLLK